MVSTCTEVVATSFNQTQGSQQEDPDRRRGCVWLEPLGVAIVVEPGETLMSAAQRRGYRWPTVCEGRAECGACYVLVQGGGDCLSPVEARERAVLDRGVRNGDTRARLACQLYVTGEARVFKRGVRPS